MIGVLIKGTRMAVMSVVSFLVNLGLFASFTRLTSWPPEMAAIAALTVVMVMNFGACKYWIFEAQGGNLKRQLVGFTLATLAFRGAELAVFSLVYRLTHLDELLLYAAVLLISFFAKLFIFEQKVFEKG